MRKLLILSLLFTPLVLRAETPKMPSDKELKALALDSLLAFNKAVQEKSFAKFHEERFSAKFRQQFPLDKFSALFQGFIEKGYDISNIAKSEPVFEFPPAIDSNGLLVLKGHYPTKPNKVTFKLTYLNESSVWKLLGINVQATPDAPTNQELKKIVLDSLLLFNAAVQKKDFTDFYGHTAKLWQKEVTPEELLGIFQSFIDKKIDLAPIAKLEPTFDGTPAVNDEGILVVKGSYPTEPSKVLFELKYVLEGQDWKSIGINVHVKPTGENADKNDNDNGMDEDDDEEDVDDGGE